MGNVFGSVSNTSCGAKPLLGAANQFVGKDDARIFQKTHVPRMYLNKWLKLKNLRLRGKYCGRNLFKLKAQLPSSSLEILGPTALILSCTSAYPAIASSLQWDSFWDWFTAKGGLHGKHGKKATPSVEVGFSPPTSTSSTNRGIFAAEDIPQSALILAVPPCLQLGVQSAESCELAPMWQTESSTDQSSAETRNLGSKLRSPECAYLRLAMSLLCEASRGQASKFSSYIQNLPTIGELQCVDVFWDAEERRVLDDPALASKMLQRRSLVEEMYHQVVVPGWSAVPASRSLPTLEDFKWAVAIVASRGFASQKDMCLVPGLDLVNHHPASNANAIAYKVMGSEATVLNVPDGSYVLRAVDGKDIIRGTEVLHSYRKDNHLGVVPAQELIRDYGFLPDCEEEALRTQFYENKEDLISAFQKVNAIEREPVEVISELARKSIRDKRFLDKGVQPPNPRIEMALRYRYGQRLLLGAQYIHALANVFGTLEDSKSMVREVVSNLDFGNEDYRNAYLKSQMSMVDICLQNNKA